MDSGVVTRATEASAGRGVGASTGTHDDGKGEQDDVRAAMADLRRRLPAGSPVALAAAVGGWAAAVAA